jgi:hypothetical protein
MPFAVKTCPNKAKKEKPQDPNLHWVKFEIKDDKGTPLSKITLKVKLPSGSIEQKTSDETGIINVKNIKPGKCELITKWKDYTVFETGFIQ